jgi:ribosomal protein S10
MTAMPPHHTLGKAALERLLAQRAPPPDLPASSLYLRPGSLQGKDGSFLEQAGAAGQAWRERVARLGDAVAESDTGVAGLRAGDWAAVVLPPFPVREDRLTPAWEPGPLLALAGAPCLVGVVLLRLGRYSVAVYRGPELLSSKTGSWLVHARHHKGGSSSARFQRRREDQIHHLCVRVCEVAREQFDPHLRTMDHLLLGGERLTLVRFLKTCDYLEQFRGRLLSRRLNVRDPKRDTLEQVGEMLAESRVYELEW